MRLVSPACAPTLSTLSGRPIKTGSPWMDTLTVAASHRAKMPSGANTPSASWTSIRHVPELATASEPLNTSVLRTTGLDPSSSRAEPAAPVR